MGKTAKVDPQARYVVVKGKIHDEWAEIPADPLDFSFKEIADVTAIIDEEPRSGTKMKDLSTGKEERVLGADGKFVEVKAQQKRMCTALRLCNNRIASLEGFVDAVSKVIEDPKRLSWIDLSFNQLKAIDAFLTAYTDLTVLYLHANEIQHLYEVDKLAALPKLHTLTLHGNPMENVRGYRLYVVYRLPTLRHLDFCAVTKAERATARRQGPFITAKASRTLAPKEHA